ncbi:MAG TPA: SRPBCC domain-containing protein [Flavobacteriales bacterium]|nr:SRPBCC domain-containing protein [Flavobacteriales bacterium]
MNTAANTKKLELTITRTIDAPRELVFACWTRAEHLARWGGAPAGMTAEAETKEIRTGGRYKVHLRHENGDSFTVQGEYVEVTRPERLVFTHAWIGADGEPGQEMLVTITFTEQRGRTKMTLRQQGFTSASSRDGHKEGWSSQIDRFTAYVNSIA